MRKTIEKVLNEMKGLTYEEKSLIVMNIIIKHTITNIK